MSEWQGIGGVATVSDRTTSPVKSGGFDLLTLGSALLTFVLTFMLVRQRFSASSSAQPPTPDVVDYWVTAGIMIAIQIGLLLRAILRRRGGLMLIASIALILTLGVALFLSVPEIDWRPDPPTPTINPNYRPCYSGSGDCIGG
ncbi:DUF6234 family protein [Cryobacterium sp. M15]|uniref:DUF6234 family protein n=1 Tax=Cryobacterium sp. M15 TaxID=2048291 RepID=UPI000CE3824C|nr:DUF6234 family protein [Cryobacterium sp. M15]